MSQVSIIDIEGNHPQIPTQFDANVGFAVPIANVLEILSAVVAAGSIPTQTVGSGNTITTNIQISQAIAATDATKIGLSAFNSADFTVDANGFVSLLGPAATSAYTVDAFTAPGTNPVVPNGSGIITVTGGQVASGTVGANIIRTDSLAANTYKIEIQRSTAVPATNSANNGVSHFDSGIFTVDSNAFVSITNFNPFAYKQLTVADSPYTVLSTDNYLSCDSSGGAITIRLPDAPTTLRRLIIKDRTGSAAINNLLVTTVGGAVTIDGSTTYIMVSNYSSIQLLFNATSYEVY